MQPMAISSNHERSPVRSGTPWRPLLIGFFTGCFVALAAAYGSGGTGLGDCAVASGVGAPASPSLVAVVPQQQPFADAVASTGVPSCWTETRGRRAVSERYERLCGFWSEKFAGWGRHFAEHPNRGSLMYMCSHSGSGDKESACHGIGDRFSGIHTTLHYALAYNKSLVIDWHYFNKIFEPSCRYYPPGVTSWGVDAEAELQNKNYEQCEMAPRSQHCERMVDRGSCMTKEGANAIFPHPQRACTTMPVAWMSDKGHPPFTPGFESECTSVLNSLAPADKDSAFASMEGCPLRTLFQPNLSLLHTLVPFRQNNATEMHSLASIEKLFEQFYVITIYVRVHLAERDGHNVKIPEKYEPMKAFECALSLEEDAARRNLTGGRPIKWYFASDSVWLRNRAVEHFSDRVMMADYLPQHVSKVDKDTSHIEALQQAMTEWYLMSLGDDAIINHFSTGHQRTQLWQGKRVSGFAASSWAYSLRSAYVDAGTCQREELEFDGSWSHAFEVDTCPKASMKFCPHASRHQRCVPNSSGVMAIHRA